GLESPHIHVLAWKNPAVDGDGQLNLAGPKSGFVLDDLGQIADNEAQLRRRALGRPQAPGSWSQRGVGGEAAAGGQVARIVLGLLRIGHRKDRALEPERRHTFQRGVGLDAEAEHLETTALVEEESADANVDRLAELAARGEDERGRRRLGMEGKRKP